MCSFVPKIMNFIESCPEIRFLSVSPNAVLTDPPAGGFTTFFRLLGVITGSPADGKVLGPCNMEKKDRYEVCERSPF